MKIRLFSHMEECTPEEIGRLMSIVPEWRRKEAEKFKHEMGQFCCLKSWEMLMQLAENKALGAIRRNEYGKPYFAEADKETKDTDSDKTIVAKINIETRDTHSNKANVADSELYFSISHCKKGIIVVVSETECGVDIEDIDRKISEPLVEKTMSEEEILQIGEDKSRFFELWTQKEALLKKRGTGITDDLQAVLADKEEDILTFVHQKSGFAWSICQDRFSEEERSCLGIVGGMSKGEAKKEMHKPDNKK